MHVSHFACILVIGSIELKWNVNYEAVVGNKKKEFLMECTKEYGLNCVDARKGSIIVTMESPQELSSDGTDGNQLQMQDVVKRIKAEGFLPKSENFAISKEKFEGVIKEGGTRVVR